MYRLASICSKVARRLVHCITSAAKWQFIHWTYYQASYAVHDSIINFLVVRLKYSYRSIFTHF